MQTTDIEKSKTHIMIEIIEYVPNSVVTKTIIRKTTGNVTVVAIDTGEALTEKISPFDTFIQIIEGNAEVVIDSKSNMLKSGDGIIIPAHTSNNVKANGRFKMISTLIKSMHPIGHVGEAIDIAYGILYLVSEESKFVTGSELVIDGGYTCK
jgi:quercetin dioxygenase-like cupin family protein